MLLSSSFCSCCCSCSRRILFDPAKKKKEKESSFLTTFSSPLSLYSPLKKTQYGFGVDNVLAYRVALVTGELVTASTTGPYSDLFWALRGAGHGNFGIITSIEYRTFAQPPAPTKYTVANVTFALTSANRDAIVSALELWQSAYLNKPPV